MVYLKGKLRADWCQSDNYEIQNLHIDSNGSAEQKKLPYSDADFGENRPANFLYLQLQSSYFRQLHFNNLTSFGHYFYFTQD